jgi:hypothetical protein
MIKEKIYKQINIVTIAYFWSFWGGVKYVTATLSVLTILFLIYNILQQF